MALAAGDMTALCRDCLWTGADPGLPLPCLPLAAAASYATTSWLVSSMAHSIGDAFYASVEKRNRPELRDQALIVGGGVTGRRHYRAATSPACPGVRSAMPMFKAAQAVPRGGRGVSPGLRQVPRREPTRSSAKLADVTPPLQTLSLDEAWLDLSGTERLHGAIPALTLARLQGEIEREIGITVSIGLAANKFLAKIASDLDKPRGFAVIGGAQSASLAPAAGLRSCQASAQWCSPRRLESDGYATVGDLAAADLKRLVDRYRRARPAPRSSWRTAATPAPSIRTRSLQEPRRETTLQRVDCLPSPILRTCFGRLCEKVGNRHARTGGDRRPRRDAEAAGDRLRIVTRRRTVRVAPQTARTPVPRVAKRCWRSEARGNPVAADRRGHLRSVPSPARRRQSVRQRRQIAGSDGSRRLTALRERFGVAASGDHGPSAQTLTPPNAANRVEKNAGRNSVPSSAQVFISNHHRGCSACSPARWREPVVAENGSGRPSYQHGYGCCHVRQSRSQKPSM